MPASRPAPGMPAAGGDGPRHGVDRTPEQDLAPLYAAAVAALTWGFRLVAALLVAGLLLGLARGEELRTRAAPLSEVLPAVLDGRASGLIELAIVTIVLTPAVTTLVLAVGFARLGDRRFAGLSLAVLAILGVSITLALLP
ncbi:MAG: hypothetical protein AVDCRST_MAG49-997 [uncultured Thermomicrobiales bacterium]|uniref:DUF1634 domain-containing protein n=1 Tax=uncultured Thermomicrobiales bacterium TaxID=1645740 RepID=A0A6J4U718_9BACT|nr:MAG: hypothetical protein AVDCRST_MAG49-997 [uncultured Thermomicrobiales bacterium]